MPLHHQHPEDALQRLRSRNCLRRLTAGLFGRLSLCSRTRRVLRSRRTLSTRVTRRHKRRRRNHRNNPARQRHSLRRRPPERTRLSTPLCTLCFPHSGARGPLRSRLTKARPGHYRRWSTHRNWLRGHGCRRRNLLHRCTGHVLPRRSRSGLRSRGDRLGGEKIAEKSEHVRVRTTCQLVARLSPAQSMADRMRAPVW